MPAPRRLTAKAIPSNPYRWRSEVEGIVAWLNNLAAWEADEGRSWCRSMQAYYVRRLRDLFNFRPHEAYQLWPGYTIEVVLEDYS